MCLSIFFSFFFFNDTATTEIYTLSLHDALPISIQLARRVRFRGQGALRDALRVRGPSGESRPVTARHPVVFLVDRSEEHTSELQSRLHLVCRLLLEKKKKKRHPRYDQLKHKSANASSR